MTQPNLQVTPAVEWQRKTELLQLPSGKVVEVRDVDAVGMLLSSPDGSIPDFITQQLADGLRGKKSKSALKVEFTPKDFPALIQIANAITRACIVTPRIVDGEPNYEAGEIHLSDINFDDRLFILNQKMPSEELATAERFRRGSAPGVAVVSEGEDLRPETE